MKLQMDLQMKLQMKSLKYTMIFLRYNDKLLMLNRLKPPLMGLWTGVGGKIEPSESPLECARREVLEETGLSMQNLIADLSFLGAVTWSSEAGEGGMYLFLGELIALTDDKPWAFDEGILDWKPIAWVLDPQNQGIPAHVKHFLPSVLTGEVLLHQCEFQNNTLMGYETCSLVDNFDADAVYE